MSLEAVLLADGFHRTGDGVWAKLSKQAAGQYDADQAAFLEFVQGSQRSAGKAG